MEMLIKNLPLIVGVGALIFIWIKAARSMRMAEGRQDEARNRIDSSIKMQAEGLDIAKAQHETMKQIQSEMVDIKRFLIEIKRELEQSKT
jgi:hypothetical protein